MTEYAGNGIGSWIMATIQCIARLNGYKVHITEISEHNRGSQITIEKLNYTLTDEYVEKDMPLLGGKHKFYKWVKRFK